MECRAGDRRLDWVWLAMGACLQLGVGWRYNIPAAAWLSPLFLMRFFRNRRRWYETLAAVPLLAASNRQGGAWRRCRECDPGPGDDGSCASGRGRES